MLPEARRGVEPTLRGVADRVLPRSTRHSRGQPRRRMFVGRSRRRQAPGAGFEPAMGLPARLTAVCNATLRPWNEEPAAGIEPAHARVQSGDPPLGVVGNELGRKESNLRGQRSERCPAPSLTRITTALLCRNRLVAGSGGGDRALASDFKGPTAHQSHREKERVAGIEPAWPAWKAGAKPLGETRMGATGRTRTCVTVSRRLRLKRPLPHL